MECCNWDARRFFLMGARVFFGVWLLYVGLGKWIFMGAPAFVGWIGAQFESTWSPPVLNMALAWLILVAEPVLAALLLVGIYQRQVWMANALLMFLLTMGQTMKMEYATVANNWQYLILCLACAALSEPSKACEHKS